MKIKAETNSKNIDRRLQGYLYDYSMINFFGEL